MLKKTLGLRDATAMVVGTIIGASIFVQPSEISSQMPTPAGILLVWVAAGLLTMCGALVCAELASAFPRTGGVYVYLTEAWSPAARSPTSPSDSIAAIARLPIAGSTSTSRRPPI